VKATVEQNRREGCLSKEIHETTLGMYFMKAVRGHRDWEK